MPVRSTGLLCFDERPACSSFYSFIPVARSGRRRTKAPGRSQKGWSIRARATSKQPSGRPARNWALTSMESSRRWAGIDSRAGRWRPRGRPATRPLRHQEFDVRNGVAAKVGPAKNAFPRRTVSAGFPSNAQGNDAQRPAADARCPRKHLG